MFLIKKSYVTVLLSLILGSWHMVAASTHTFNELLKCNLARRDIAALCNVDYELQLYYKALPQESNYAGVPTLAQWKDVDYTYPSIHPAHQALLDAVAPLNISTVCDLGAGCGKVSKFLYAANPQLNITCVEHNARHLVQLRENFETNTGVIKPDVTVKAQIIRGCLPDLSFLSSDSYDLVFTCTVMMHLPFIIAVKSAQEIVRISKRYILHVENKNEGNNWYNMTIVNSPGMSPINYIGIDYVRLYESLGVKKVLYFEFKDPATPATFVVYLGEKV